MRMGRKGSTAFRPVLLFLQFCCSIRHCPWSAFTALPPVNARKVVPLAVAAAAAAGYDPYAL